MPPKRQTPKVVIPGIQGAYIEGRASRVPGAPQRAILIYQKRQFSLNVPFDPDAPAAVVKRAKTVIKEIAAGKRPGKPKHGAEVSRVPRIITPGRVLLSDAQTLYMEIRMKATADDLSDEHAKRRHRQRRIVAVEMMRAVFPNDFAITNEAMLEVVARWMNNPTGVPRKIKPKDGGPVHFIRRPLQPSTAKVVRNVLARFLKFCRAMQWITVDILEIIPPAKKQHIPKMDHEVQQRLVAESQGPKSKSRMPANVLPLVADPIAAMISCAYDGLRRLLYRGKRYLDSNTTTLEEFAKALRGEGSAKFHGPLNALAPLVQFFWDRGFPDVGLLWNDSGRWAQPEPRQIKRTLYRQRSRGDENEVPAEISDLIARLDAIFA
ncbi:MAG TPA: hypothetical protein VHI13_04495 [Candidatus Kapabacteria bacterium]|nr:hypothetical protein [Candidatus Kapabacteria bacterium]